MRLEKEIPNVKINVGENNYSKPGVVECFTVDGQELIDTIKNQINNVSKNEAGIYQVELNNEIEWVTGHNPQGMLAEALTSNQDNLDRMMIEALAIATVSKYYENSESGVPENVTAAEHDLVGEIAFRLAKNPWHDAKKFMPMNLHTDITKSLKWVDENAGEKGSKAGWFMIPVAGFGLVACNPTINTAAPTVDVAPSPTSTATNSFIEATKIPTSTSVPTEMPTATVEVSKFTAEAISFVPKTIEEIGQSIEVRSPIDDPNGYREDIAKVLAVIHSDILPNYEGELIRGDKKQVGIDEDSRYIYLQDGIALNPIASVYFEWNGHKVPRLFFPAEDEIGRFTLSMILDPERDLIMDGLYPEENPAPNWNMSELIKRFPMQLVGHGFFITYYSYYPNDNNQEFTSAYYQNNDPKLPDGSIELGQAYRDFIYGQPFPRESEVESLISIGGY